MRGDDPRRLNELVNDERARRAYAEKELARQRTETRMWRRRARVAEAAAKFSIRLPGRKTPAPPPQDVPERRRITFPSIRVGVSGAPGWIHRAFDAVDIATIDEAGMAGLDLVIVGGTEVPEALRRWFEWPGRQPLIAFDPSNGLAQALGGTGVDVLVGGGPIAAAVQFEAATPIEPMEPSGALEAEEVAQRIVGSRGRTIRDTAATLLEAVGMEAPRGAPEVTAVLMTRRPHRVGAAIEQLGRMDTGRVHVAVGTHGFDVAGEVRRLAETRFGDRVRFQHFPEQVPMGRCLNMLLEDTTTEAWAKIDDDDHYGPLYLEEAVLELERTGADLVGKLTHHLYDSRLDRTFLMESGNEYRFTSYVPGPTFVGRRSTWEAVRFPHRHARVDSTFIRGMNALGMSIYSTSRFEFAYGRGGDEHTWQVDESLYEARGRVVAEGFAGEVFYLPSEGRVEAG